MPPKYPIQLAPPSVIDLVAIYDEFTAAGLSLLPKNPNSKTPYAKFWHKDTGYTPTRDEAIAYKHGWCVRCGDNRVFVLDFDNLEIERGGNNAEELYLFIQNLSETCFVLQSPSGGVHLYYKVPENLPMLTNKATPIKGLDARGEGGQVVTCGGYNTYVGQSAVKKGVPDGHRGTYTKLEGGVYSHVPEMTQALYDYLTVDVPLEVAPIHEGELYGKTAEGAKRVEQHLSVPLVARERLTLECLSVILEKWGTERPYENWVQLWMSAHHSCNTERVMNFFIEHPQVLWTDGKQGQDKFIATWKAHEYRLGGFTVSSLFWLARKAGWLQGTGYELDTPTRVINTQYIPTWLADIVTTDEIPKRVCLQSQTGSGKTQTLIQLFDLLDSPKTVVFVPTVKLAQELNATLRRAGLPSEVYIGDNNRSKDVKHLLEAKILVTTLQTFSVKIYPRVKMGVYGLVYIEESDQLIQAFARGGGGLHASQVRENEARQGFSCLQEAIKRCNYVWAVDATMTRITPTLFKALAPESDIEIIKNQWVEKKAPVKILETADEAIKVVLNALNANKSVVVVSDTASRAEEVHNTMKTVFPNKRTLLITRDTGRSKEVASFMRDVDTQAATYDLVCYNSVMASGVSIQFKPDVIVQFCVYLTPQNNIQMLNRYRQQSSVYVYYRTGENLYAERADILLRAFRDKASLEALFVGLDMVERSHTAKLRAQIASMSVSHDALQQRAARSYYIHQLALDGRAVTYGSVGVDDQLKHTIEGVRAIKKEKQAFIRSHWPTVPPKEDYPDEWTDLEVALSETHLMIEKQLLGNIPSNETPELIYDIVKAFSGTSYVLSALVNPKHAVTKAQQHVLDAEKAVSAIRNNITLVRVAKLTELMYPNGFLEPLDLSGADTFVTALTTTYAEAYNAVTRVRQRLEVVYDPTNIEGSAIELCKIILSLVGLKQRYSRKGKDTPVYTVENYKEALVFLSWRGVSGDGEITLGDTEKVNNLTLEDKRKVMVSLGLIGYDDEQLVGLDGALEELCVKF